MNRSEDPTRGSVAVTPRDSYAAKLALKRPLIVKFGADPTAPDLHLGHAIVLRALRRFQEAGHKVVFLIGDFTARIGDPTDRIKTRPPLTGEQIAVNSATYFEQVGRILSRDAIMIRYNSEWLAELTSEAWLKLCAKVTLARLTEREDFAQRIASHTSIGFHELLYPLMQGYDSVALNADVELGGTDQTFNLLMGRTLQEQFGQDAQITVTFPLLKGLDGSAKMSKSHGNIIGLTDPASEAFGKLMSISDELMWHYRELLLEEQPATIAALRAAVASGDAHPMELKKEMAFAIIEQFWSRTEAEEARSTFTKAFQQHDYSSATPHTSMLSEGSCIWIGDLLKELCPDETGSQLRRLILSGAIMLDAEKVIDPTAQVTIRNGMIIKVGKHRFFRIITRPRQ